MTRRQTTLLAVALLYFIIAAGFWWRAYEKARKAGVVYDPAVQNSLIRYSLTWPYQALKGNL